MYEYNLYKKAELITKRELSFYNYLKEFTDKKGLVLFTKVRLADIIMPQASEESKTYNTSFNNIKSMHVDFIICDRYSLNVLIAIEVDDKTHERIDRIKRDKFLNHALFTAEIPIIHTYNTKGLDVAINDILNFPLQKSNKHKRKKKNIILKPIIIMTILFLFSLVYYLLMNHLLVFNNWPPPYPG